jgi:hypothetical protein
MISFFVCGTPAPWCKKAYEETFNGKLTVFRKVVVK